MEWTKELTDRFMTTDPATYGHYLGVRFMSPKVKPLNKSLKMIGPAYTVKLLGKDSCALYKALQEAPKGSVIVIDHSGDEVYASTGEMVARNAKALGMAGIVTSGMATDSLWLSEMDFPVFCTGTSVVTTNVWGVSGEYNIPVSCGGATVNPGDIIFGDADGVVVMNPENYEEHLEKAEAAVKREVEMREKFARGEAALKSVDGLIEANIPGIIAEKR
ncbi:RraA family protein [Anaeropeptidivorans aminofermentans]|uniref:RraA family protein n=1 Tax=Anaeropeptidivorans aminofermentans TaxID=2934315 RepID=UPI00202477BD|nr:RraA family protein [Anaeropeptidivorans aminofermentans]